MGKFPIGATVKITEEPIHYNPFKYPDKPMGENGGLEDMSHLVGLKCKVTGFFPLPLGNVEMNKEEGVGYYSLDVPKTEKGIPLGLLAIGFPNNILKLIED